jgi:ribose/xylose/arabinose/galactoside ABC-type transport system permease subunit
MALSSNALTLLGVDVYWQQFVVGVVLITTVVIYTLGRSWTLKSSAYHKSILQINHTPATRRKD